MPHADVFLVVLLPLSARFAGVPGFEAREYNMLTVPKNLRKKMQRLRLFCCTSHFLCDILQSVGGLCPHCARSRGSFATQIKL